jgi:hypothetical protein
VVLERYVNAVCAADPASKIDVCSVPPADSLIILCATPARFMD